MKAALIVFFRLFLVGVEINEKTSSFFKRIQVFYFLKGISCKHDYSAFKIYTVCRGLCSNKER